MQIAPHLAEREYDELGLVVLYDKLLRQLHVLEGTGASIWKLLRKDIGPSDIARRIAEEYDCGDVNVLSDVDKFLESLKDKGLVDGGLTSRKKGRHDVHAGAGEEEQLLDLMADAQIPYNVTWELTNACNLRCQHCYCPEIRDNVWSSSVIREALEVLRTMGTIDIQLTGGECVSHPDFAEFLALSSELGFVTSILTNGTLVDEEKAEQIAEAMPRAVQVSLYALAAQVHDAFTGVSGSHQRTLRGIKNLQDVGISPIIACSVSTANIGEVSALHGWAKDQGLEIRFAFKIAPSYNPGKVPESFRCALEEIHPYLTNPEFNRMFKAVEEGRSRVPWNSDKLCQAGFRSICLSANGDVFPCNTLRMRLGNLTERGLKEIWSDSNELARWRRVSIQDYPKCNACEARRICGPCPADHFAKTGRLDAIDLETCRNGWANYRILTGPV